MTKKNSFSKILSVLLCIVLIAAMALTLCACGNDNNTTAPSEAPVQSVEPTQAVTPEATEVGEGDTAFSFKVVDADGKETDFIVNTNEKTVGAALLAVELIAGEDSDYGLYVKTVNGITADYDVDGSYWAFYINGEYASTGVDATDVEPGAEYMFKVEK